MKKFVLLTIFSLCFILLPLNANGKPKGSTNDKKKPILDECPMVYYFESGYYSGIGKLYTYFVPDEYIGNEKLKPSELRPAYKFLDSKTRNSITFFSYSSDSHKHLKDYIYIDPYDWGIAVDGKFSGFMGVAITKELNKTQQLLSDTVPGKSHIITFAAKKTRSIIKDDGIKSKEELLRAYKKNPKRSIFEKSLEESLQQVNGEYIHLLQVSSKDEWELIDGFPLVEDFSGETANIILHYGTTEEVVVKLPNESIRINKNALPEIGIGDGSKVIICDDLDFYSTNNNELFMDTLKNPFENFKQGKLSYKWLDYSNHYYILNQIQIVKKEKDYYVSNYGWKIYVPDSRYEEYFDQVLREKKKVIPADNQVGYKLCLIKNNDIYELVFEATPFVMAY